MALGGGVAGVARLVVDVDKRGVDKGLRQLERDVDHSAKRIGGSLSTLAKVGIGAGIGAGVFALTSAFRASIDEMMNAQKVAAQTNAVLKSTGGVAGVSAKQVDELADSLLRKTGIDDEAIKSGENLLLTFTNIRNVAGEGNDIFNQSTKILLDMSVALGEDVSSSAIRLGKALQDPILGVTALRRVGVAFDASQKEQIKSMVASGNVMGAQKLILRELTREFGGSAEAAGKTLPGQLNILRETLRNTGAQLLTGLTPAITKLVQKLLAWSQELESNKQLQHDIQDAIHDFIDTTTDAIDIVRKIVDLMGGWKNASQFIIAGTLAAKVGKLAGAFTILAGAEGAAGVAGAGGGKGIAGAAGSAARLSASLNAIVALGTITTLLRIKIVTDDNVPGWVKALVIGQLSPLGAAIFGGKKAIDALTGGGGAKQAPGPVAPPGGFAPGTRPGNLPGGGIQVPTSQRSTHPTAGLAGYPAVDYFAKPGTPVRAPENGAVVRHSGHPGTTSGQVYGSSLYYDGFETGNSYFITHLMWVAPLGNYSRGDVIGRVSAWSGGSPHAHIGIAPGAGGRRGGAAAPTAGAAPAKAKPAPLIPQKLELAVAEAEVTKGTADDLRALRNVESYLEKRLASERNVNKRLALLRELKSIRSQIAGVGGGRATKGLEDLIPAGLEHGLAKAELTKTLDDDLKALADIEAYLEKRLAATKKLTEQTRIMRELKDVRAQMEGILGSIGADKKAIDKLIGDIISGTETLVQGPRDRPASMFTPGTDFQGRITTKEGKTELTKLLASLEPEKQRIRDWAKEMQLKKDAAIERRKSLRAQLAKLDKTPARLRTARWRVARASLVAAIAELTQTIAQLDEGINRAFGMWADIEATETSEVQKLAEEDEQRASQPPDTGGGGGGDFGGDTGGGDTRSAADIQAEIDRNVTGYLGAQRDLVRSYSSNVLAAAFAGQMGEGSLLPIGGGVAGSITVTNIFPTPPPDPHAWSVQLGYELKALGA